MTAETCKLLTNDQIHCQSHPGKGAPALVTLFVCVIETVIVGLAQPDGEVRPNVSGGCLDSQATCQLHPVMKLFKA